MRYFKLYEYSTAVFENGEWVDKLTDIYYLNEDEVIKQAKYYYHNSDEEEDIDLDNLENAIAFVERVDKVEEISEEEYERHK